MPTSKRLNVAVVGATGLVGQQMLKILVQRKFPVANVIAFASERSVGATVAFNGEHLTLRRLEESSFQGVDIAMFAAGADISLQYAPSAAEAGALVIDKSSAWRMKANVPLVVPEVNPDDIRENEGMGAGRALMDELEEQTEAIAAGKKPTVAATSHQLAYNVIPGGWKPDADGYNEEEMKLVHETRKILHDPDL
ncbi:MAG: aspartate-semialdehyde dehydrogenase, partial [Chloroflexi bacterium]